MSMLYRQTVMNNETEVRRKMQRGNIKHALSNGILGFEMFLHIAGSANNVQNVLNVLILKH